jgi:hypothetical protein
MYAYTLTKGNYMHNLEQRLSRIVRLLKQRNHQIPHNNQAKRYPNEGGQPIRSSYTAH